MGVNLKKIGLVEWVLPSDSKFIRHRTWIKVGQWEFPSVVKSGADYCDIQIFMKKGFFGLRNPQTVYGVHKSLIFHDTDELVAFKGKIVKYPITRIYCDFKGNPSLPENYREDSEQVNELMHINKKLLQKKSMSERKALDTRMMYATADGNNLAEKKAKKMLNDISSFQKEFFFQSGK